jgi:hypothetical protein
MFYGFARQFAYTICALEKIGKKNDEIKISSSKWYLKYHWRVTQGDNLFM